MISNSKDYYLSTKCNTNNNQTIPDPIITTLEVENKPRDIKELQDLSDSIIEKQNINESEKEGNASPSLHKNLYLPSSIEWRENTLFGRIFALFEQIAHLLKSLWVSYPTLVDQQLLAALHFDKALSHIPFLEKAPLSTVLKHTCDFLKKNQEIFKVPKSLIAQLEECHGYTNELEFIQNLTINANSMKKLEYLSTKILKRIHSLKEGESCLIPADWQDKGISHHTLLQVKREKTGLTLQLISRDPSLPGSTTMISAGKLKIYPFTTFSGIDDKELNTDWLQALLFLSIPDKEMMICRPDALSLISLFKKFENKLVPPELNPNKFHSYTSSTNRAKNVWMLVDLAINPNGESSSKAQTRRKLRLELSTFFEFFAVTRSNLSNNETNRILLKDGLQKMTAHIALMLQKNEISEDEANCIGKEFDVIEKYLEKASAKTSLKTGKKSDLKTHKKSSEYRFQKPTIDLKPFVPKKINSSSTEKLKLREPFTTQPKIDDKLILPEFSGNEIKFDPKTCHQTLAELNKQCQELENKGQFYLLQEKIIGILNKLEFQPIERDENSTYVINNDEFWSLVSPEDRESCSRELLHLSQKLIKSIEKTNAFWPDRFLYLGKSLAAMDHLARLNSKSTFLTPRFRLAYEIMDTIQDTLYFRRFSFSISQSIYQFNQYISYVRDQYLLIPDDLRKEYFKNREERISHFRQHLKNTTGKEDFPSQINDIVTLCNSLENLLYHPDFTSTITKEDKTIIRVYTHKQERGCTSYYTSGNVTTMIKSPLKRVIEDTRPFESFPLKKALKNVHISSYTFCCDEDGKPNEYAAYNNITSTTQESVADNPTNILKGQFKNDSDDDENGNKNFSSLERNDLRDLLFTLQINLAPWQIMGLLQEKPHLLDEADVRNFCEVLLFRNNTILDCIETSPAVLTAMSEWIENSIKALKKQERALPLLFMIDLNHKIKALLASSDKHKDSAQLFKDYTHELRLLAVASLDASSTSYPHRNTIWTYLLTSYYSRNDLSIKEATEILYGFSLLQGSPAEMYEEDPIKKRELEVIREKLSTVIGEAFEKSDDLLQSTLDIVSSGKGIPFVEGKWTGKFPIYELGQYQLNVLTGEVKRLSDGGISAPMPVEMVNSPLIKEAFAGQNPSSFFTYFFDEEDGRRRYVFEDASKIAYQVIIHADKKIHLYSETIIDGKTQWMEFVPKTILFGANPEIKPLDMKNGLFAFVKSYLYMNAQKSMPKIPAWLTEGNYQFWANPNNANEVYVVNRRGETLYQLVFKDQKKGRILSGMVDLRDGVSREIFEVDTLAKDSDSAWDCLSKIEKRGHILVWRKNGKIDHIELPRLGLSFCEKEGKIICITPPSFKDWILDPQDLTTSTKGIAFGLTLKHPTIQNKKMVLVPNGNFEFKIPTSKTPHLLQVLWMLLKIRLGYLGIKAAMRSFAKFLDPLKSGLHLKENDTKNPIWAFDVDPHTHQWRHGTGQSSLAYFHLAYLSLLSQNHQNALEFILQAKKIMGNTITSDEEMILSKICRLPLADANSVAIRLHLQNFVHQKTPHINQFLVPAFQEYLTCREQVDASLKLSQEEEIGCWKVIKQLDPEFYSEQAPLLIPNETNERRFVKASLKTKSFFIDNPLARGKIARGKISQFADKCFKSRLEKKKSVTLHPLLQTEETLSSNFLEFYVTASVSKIDAPDFQKLKLMLDFMPSGDPDLNNFTPNDFTAICQKYLAKVINLRTGGKEIEFPKIPDINWDKIIENERKNKSQVSHQIPKTDSELRNQSEMTFSQFLQSLDGLIGEDLVIPIDSEKSSDEKPVFTPKDELAFHQLEKDMDRLIKMIESNESTRTIDEYTVDELEKMFESTKQTKASETNLISKQKDPLITSENAHKFFKEIENPLLSINLDLSDLKKSEEPAIQAKAREIDEEILFAQEEAKKEKCWEIKSEESRLELEKMIEEQLKKAEEDSKKSKEQIMGLFDQKLTVRELWAKKGHSVKTLQWDTLLSHYLQQDLESISDLFGKEVDIKTLKEQLNQYLVVATREQRLLSALEEIRKMAPDVEGINATSSQDLYRILTAERLYDPTLQPQLLTFEYILGLLIRGEQPNLVSDLLNDPQCVKQAITGMGKTTVILVLTALMKANGSNLVTLTFPKPLFEANLRDLESKLGKIFSRHVFALRFHMQMALKVNKKDEKGEKIVGIDGKNEKESIFKGMYQNLLKTVLQKGTVATTKESLHALEQKLIRLVDQMSKMPLDQTIDPIEWEHIDYLGKILTLMRERQEKINDEFDQALTSKEQSHLKTGETKKIGPFILETTLDVYERLLKEEKLGLRKNIQEELPPEDRSKILLKVATDIANDYAQKKNIDSKNKEAFVKAFVNYTTGVSEEFLEMMKDWEVEDQAKVIVLKDQLHIFLPLTLSKTCGIKYIRSKDGIHTVPCLRADIPKENGEAHEVLEKINYLIQDYYQNGIQAPVFKEWFIKLKKEAKSDVANGKAPSIDESLPGKLFQSYFPKRSLALVLESDLEVLREQVNNDTSLIRRFLEIELAKLEVALERISVDSQNFVSMSKATSGVSATLGCLHGLHRKIHRQKAHDRGATGKMILNIINKSKDSSSVLTYDPEHPETLIDEALKQDTHFQSVIDGVAALHGVPALLTAKKLLTVQNKDSSIKGIMYSEINNGDKICTEKGSLTLDRMPLKPHQQGTIITHEGCRGKDVKLGKDNRALITANNRQNLEDLLQTAGRLRLDSQKLRYDVPKESGLKTTDDVIRSSIVTAAMSEADELFRSKKDELRDIVRSEMMQEILGHILKKDYSQMRERYLKFEKANILVQRSEGEWDSALTYCEKHAHIQHKDKSPHDVLNATKERYLKMAESLELKNAAAELEKLTYSDEILQRLPKYVIGSEQLTDQEVEVENEVEVDTEVDEDADVDIDNEVDPSQDMPWYLPWVSEYSPARYATHSLQSIHKAFSENIKFTENFLPLKRKEWAHPRFHRQPHDKAQNPIHYVRFVKAWDKVDYMPAGSPVLKAEVVDILETKSKLGYNYYYKHGKIGFSFIYDMRTKNIMDKGKNYLEGDEYNPVDLKEIAFITAQLRFFDGQYQDYSDEELQALKAWLNKQNPDEMENYFVKTILRHRSQDQQRYYFSKLRTIFNEIRSENLKEELKEEEIVIN